MRPLRAVDGSANLLPIQIRILREVQQELGTKVDPTEDCELCMSHGELQGLVEKVSLRLGFELSAYERDEILLYVEKEARPFGVLQELVEDPQISDIIVSSYCKVNVQQQRRNFATDIMFPSQEIYEGFVQRLLTRAKTSYSTKSPIADGMIGGFARIHVVHKSLAEEGPYLTIRLNRFSEVKMDDLIKGGTAPRIVFEYLGGLVRSGHTILVVGEVGTGKTTLVRALAAAVPNQESILVIEDTPEIRLAHPNVRYLSTRDANIEGEGRISPGHCIRAGMRMAMNRIIFGEMRDAEASEAFIDVCASGHPGLSTLHAKSSAEALVRLKLFLGRAQRGVAHTVLDQQVSTAVQLIVVLDICRVSGARRIIEIKEIASLMDGALQQRPMFQYKFANGRPVWKVLNRISCYREKLEQERPPINLRDIPVELSLSEMEVSGAVSC